MATVDYTTQIEKLYIAYFGRPGDPAGVAYWNQQANASNGNFEALYSNFAISAEYTTLHNGQTNTQLVQSLYQYLFGRTPATDDAGLNYWLTQLTAQTVTVGKIAAALVSGALGSDVTTLNNKAAAATTYTAHLDTPTEQAAYGGTAVFNSARGFLATVTTTLPTDTAIDARIVIDIAATGTVSGSSFSLTSAATDIISATTGNDTVTGALGTMQTGDVISDPSATDNDTLNASVSGYVLGAVKPTLANIETVNVTGTILTTGLDLTNVTGIKTLTLSGATSGTTATVDLVTAAKAASVVAGTNVSVLNVNTSTVANNTAGSVAVNTGSVTTTTITGQTGNDTYAVTLGAAGQTLNLVGGTGVDTFSLTLPGGTTTLTTDNGAVETLNLISNGSAANTVNVTNASGTLLTGALASGYGAVVSGTQNLTLATDPDNVTGLSITKAAGYTGTLTLKTNAAGVSAFQGILADTVSITGTATTKDVTVNTASTLSLGIDNGTQVYNVENATTTLTAGTGTLTMVAGAAQTSFTTGANVQTLNLSASAPVTFTALVENAATTAVAISGSKDVTITTLTLAAPSATVASSYTGNLTIGATAGAFAATVIGGSGNDSITVTKTTWTGGEIRGGDGNDTITLAGTGAFKVDGGNGNDTIGGNNAASTLLGGAGTDTITSGATTAANFINGGDGADTIALAAGGGIETVQFGASSTWGDTITGFTVNEDVLAFSASNGYSALSHGTTTGKGTVVVALAADLNRTILAANTTIQVSNEQKSGVVTASALQAAGWVITGEVAGNHVVVCQYNDATHMSVFDVVSANNDGLITSADTVTLVGTVTVSAATGLTAADFSVV